MVILAIAVGLMLLGVLIRLMTWGGFAFFLAERAIDFVLSGSLSDIETVLVAIFVIATSMRARWRERRAEQQGQSKMLDLIEHVSQSGASPGRSRAVGD
jgi:hypothetical protein